MCMYEFASEYIKMRGFTNNNGNNVGIKYLEKAAAAGNGRALYVLGRWYVDGSVTRVRCIEQGLEYLQRAAFQRHVPSMSLYAKTVEGYAKKTSRMEEYAREFKQLADKLISSITTPTDATDATATDATAAMPATTATPDDSKRARLAEIFAKIDCIEAIVRLPEEVPDHASFNNAKLSKLVALAKPLMKLTELVGMEDVKEQLYSQICAMMHAGRADKHKHNHTHNHIVIAGSPGVGKTHLANVICELMFAMGVVKKNKPVMPDKADILGKYVGHTAANMKNIIDDAKDAVLFIDEAYGLGVEDADSGSGNSCREAIDTLLQALDTGKFVCIIAGYSDMLTKCFFNMNVGLRRRFRYWYDIKNPNANQLCTIFDKKLASHGWSISENDVAQAHAAITADYGSFTSFGGDVEGLIEHAIQNWGVCQMKAAIDCENGRKTLTKANIEAGLAAMKKNKTHKAEHLSMYS